MEHTKFSIPAHISFDGLVNARHLGGYPARGGLTRKEAYIRCENPEKMTPADIERMYQFGIRMVIDLRSPEEYMAAPNPMQKDERFDYRNLPVFQTDASPNALTKQGIPMGELYIYMLDQCMPAFQRIFSAILEADGGVLFHCSAGKDRTGVLAALLLLLAGVEESVVVCEYAYTQILLAPLVEQLKSGVPEGVSRQYAEDMLAARPEYIMTAIAHLNEVYGGAEGYLAKLGFSREDIGALCGRLTQEKIRSEKGA